MPHPEGVRDYYQRVWDYPFVVSTTCRPWRERSWSWFQQVDDESVRPYLMGMVPFLCLIDEAASSESCPSH